VAEDWPKIVSRRTIPISPWMNVIERAVEFSPGAAPELYHAVAQQDYIAIVARTPEGLIPIVRQYRPALERFTWELPAGLVDKGEDPAETCRRELLEETGLVAEAIHPLGSMAACTVRMSNRVHSFYVRTGPRRRDASVEHGIEVRFATPAEIADLTAEGDFVLQLHLGALLLAGLQGQLDLSEFAVLR
jgi:ADP-ribose pyrophosphatase